MILREQSKVHNKSLEYNVKPQQVTREEIDYNVSKQARFCYSCSKNFTTYQVANCLYFGRSQELQTRVHQDLTVVGASLAT